MSLVRKPQSVGFFRDGKPAKHGKLRASRSQGTKTNLCGYGSGPSTPGFFDCFVGTSSIEMSCK